MYVKNPRSFRKIASSNPSLSGSVGVGKVSKMEPVAFVQTRYEVSRNRPRNCSTASSMAALSLQLADIRENDTLVAEFVAGQKHKSRLSDLSECPLSLAKASYMLATGCLQLQFQWELSAGMLWFLLVLLTRGRALLIVHHLGHLF
ncbi:uncharacterized protein LOC103929219 [Pyrus x bretschneideri]|uniref:uncharacterized protein LOC103929219 n=1 Tax=Pyrus x bretschneideri TaxID=225117 RepID=UPI00202F8F0C|nr:uncharacterized protein LOC103929219 [Pyrus x bretschneideri]